MTTSLDSNPHHLHPILSLFTLSQSPAVTNGNCTAAFRELAETTAETLAVERVSFWLFDASRCSIYCANLFTRSTHTHADNRNLNLTLAINDYPSYFQAVLSEPVLAANDTYTDPRTQEFSGGYLESFGIVSMMDANVYLEGEIQGLICCEQVGDQRVWTIDEQYFLRSVANLAALTLEVDRRQQKSRDLQNALDRLAQSQIKLIQTEKMASVGNLMAGVAHEINNPLSFLKGSVTNLHEYFEDLIGHLALYEALMPANPEILDRADEIELDFLRQDLPKILAGMETAIDRITAISGNLRTFCRSDHCGKTAVDLHDCLETALLLLKYRSKATETRPKIRVTREYGTLPNVSCFPGQLSQVFTNLLANAIDMFDEAFERADVPLTEPKLHIQTTLVGDTVCISIDDNGLGMEEAVQARIFEPLYTTKGAGKGTGLGLAISRQIVEESHGGHLRVRSTPGVGTGFIIELPCTDR